MNFGLRHSLRTGERSMMEAPTEREARVAREEVVRVSSPAMATRMNSRCSALPLDQVSSSSRGDIATGVCPPEASPAS